MRGRYGMGKDKTRFVCRECGYETTKWMGRCPSCEQWNTMIEEVVARREAPSAIVGGNLRVVGIDELAVTGEERFITGIGEADRVLGGGIVKGSLVLIGGDPGIGKSTLILQVCERIGSKTKVLYVSGEESVNQIKMRADRLGVRSQNIFLASETEFERIEKLAESNPPGLLIIDSIQTVYSTELTSAPGSVSQVREVTARLLRIAKMLGITVFIVGHVTKEGAIAGPRVLEHMVDTVLYFEGERHLSFRILRAVKNRFGSTNEIGIFEMTETGLQEVDNPSSVMLSGRPENAPGSVVVAGIEGTRPMLVEIQALVCETSFGMPRRMATGIDYNRVTLLIAVLEKRVGMQLHNYDAYVNVIGGIKLEEPACDLGTIIAIASSFRNIAVDSGTVFIGEVGLTGEVRAVGRVDTRVMEAMRIGFKRCVIPEANMKTLKRIKGIGEMEVCPVKTVEQAIHIVL
jgi:DNA repair protein RadA/Sms